jgi:hypothetical protein
MEMLGRMKLKLNLLGRENSELKMGQLKLRFGDLVALSGPQFGYKTSSRITPLNI